MRPILSANKAEKKIAIVIWLMGIKKRLVRRIPINIGSPPPLGIIFVCKMAG